MEKSDAPVVNSNEQYYPTIDDEIDLMEYVAEVLRYKYRIVALSLLMAIGAVCITLFIPNLYKATVLVAFNRYDKPGGVAPKDYRGSDTVSLLERDSIIDVSPENEKDRLLARVGSFEYLNLFIEKNDILKIIYSQQWDDENQKWKSDTSPISDFIFSQLNNFIKSKSKSNNDAKWLTQNGFDIRGAVKFFKDKMLYIAFDEKTDLLRVSIITPDPKLSANLSNAFVNDFKVYQRELVLSELAQRRAYLEKKLSDSSNIEFQRSIYRMLETQLSAEALINVRRNYPLEIIEPAIPPLVKDSPKRLLLAVISLVVTMFLSWSYIIGRVIFRKISQQVKKYPNRNISNANNSTGNEGNLLNPSSEKSRNIDDWIET